MGQDHEVEQHHSDCRCGECWPFNAGSEAEQRWALGERIEARKPRLPPAPQRVNGLLPGDEDVYLARVEAVAHAVPSRLGCDEMREGSQNGNREHESTAPEHGVE